MKFHLNFTPQKFDFEINHRNKIFLIGSCFSENIEAYLNQHRFKTHANPSGILFNPKSISTCLTDILFQDPFNENFILNRDGIFLSYLHHSSINAPNKTDLLEKINAENNRAHLFLKECDYLFITFGTAFFYSHLHLDQIVANCHKQAASTFEKKMITVSETVKNYNNLIKNLQQFNPNLKIVFTVSPVKYLKDGVIENNLSKSTLVLSIHELINQNNSCYYFPAYELINDDLRDYRFYKEDLAHPNELAINYVWEKFSEVSFDEKTQVINKQISKLNLALNHRQLTKGHLEEEKLMEYILKQKEEILKLDPTLSL